MQEELVAVLVELSQMKYHKVLFLEEDGMFYRETTTYTEESDGVPEVVGPFEDPAAAVYGISVI